MGFLVPAQNNLVQMLYVTACDDVTVCLQILLSPQIFHKLLLNSEFYFQRFYSGIFSFTDKFSHGTETPSSLLQNSL